MSDSFLTSVYKQNCCSGNGYGSVVVAERGAVSRMVIRRDYMHETVKGKGRRKWWKLALRGGVCRINADAFSTFLRAAQSLHLSPSLSLFAPSLPFFSFSILVFLSAFFFFHLSFLFSVRSLFNRATLGIATWRVSGTGVYTFSPLSLFSFCFCRASSALKPRRDFPVRFTKTYPRLLNARVNVNNDNGLARLREEKRGEGERWRRERGEKRREKEK